MIKVKIRMGTIYQKYDIKETKQLCILQNFPMISRKD